MKSILLIAAVIFLGVSISGCGGYGSSGSQSSLSLAGNWQFTYVSSKGGTVTVAGTLTQTGNTFSGNVTLTNSCATSGTISGTMSGYTFTATITEANPETISVTGTIATSYSTANGTYQVTSATGACASTMGDTGTWTGTHTTVSGTPYVGILRSADRMPVQLALRLSTDGGQVTGTATFANSACLHSMNVSGTLSGLNLELQGESGSDGSIVMIGTTDKEGNTLTLNSNVSGTCEGESGSGTLMKLP